MTKNQPSPEERAEYTHIINIKGSEYAHFASEFKDCGDHVEFVTTTKAGDRFKRTIAKSEISDIAEKL